MRPETACTLKSAQQIANKSIGQHLPVGCVKQSSRVWCKKNNKRVLRVRGAITSKLLFALCNGLGMLQSPLIADANKVFVIAFQV